VPVGEIGGNVARRPLKTDKMEHRIENKTMNQEKAIFAGGCFWCVECSLAKAGGVINGVSGYTGGHVANPSYDEVSSGQTGHVEAVEITYDPSKVTYNTLLEAFWKEIDPTDPGGQFADRGTQYKTAIFYMNAKQKKAAEASRDRLSKSGRFKNPIVTQILPAAPFYPAEDHHQQYAMKNATHYKLYRYGSGRGPFLQKVWGGK